MNSLWDYVHSTVRHLTCWSHVIRWHWQIIGFLHDFVDLAISNYQPHSNSSKYKCTTFLLYSVLSDIVATFMVDEVVTFPFYFHSIIYLSKSDIVAQCGHYIQLATKISDLKILEYMFLYQ